MHILKIVLEIIVVIASILLTLLILMHKGKGGGCLLYTSDAADD